LNARGGWTIDNLSFTPVGEDKLIGSADLTDEDGKVRDSNPVVITFRDGKIVDVQGCSSLHEAERFAHRRPRKQGGD
jgi:hypothetical protein